MNFSRRIRAFKVEMTEWPNPSRTKTWMPRLDSDCLGVKWVFGLSVCWAGMQLGAAAKPRAS